MPMTTLFSKHTNKDAPTTTNEHGGKQSHTDLRFDLIPAHALAKVAEVLGEGAEKYGEWNWLKIPTNDHINHALQHLYAYLAMDESDDHLSHAVCRCLFALHSAELEQTPYNQSNEFINLLLNLAGASDG